MITNDAYKIYVGAKTDDKVHIRGDQGILGTLYKVTGSPYEWNEIPPEEYDAAGNFGDGITHLQYGPDSGKFRTKKASGSAIDKLITANVVTSITGITASDLNTDYATSFEAIPQSNVDRVYHGSNAIWDHRNNFSFVSGTTRVTGKSAPILGGSSDIKSFSYIEDRQRAVSTGYFSGCENLKTVNLGNKMEEIMDDAFHNCSGLEEAAIPSGVTGIGNNAFNFCKKLKNIDIPDSVTSLGTYAFAACLGATGLNIGTGVTAIPERGFEGYGGTTATIPNNVASIGRAAFLSCDNLTTVTIGNGVTGIGISAFNSCSALTGVTIGSGVTSIEASCFEGSSGITNINILAPTAPTLGTDAFTDITGELHVPSSASSSYGSTYGGLTVVADL